MLASVFDHVVFPYSSLQLVPHDRQHLALEAARAALGPRGRIWTDLSSGFERKAQGWRCILDAFCADLGIVIQEWQRCQPRDAHLQLDISFRSGDHIIANTTEEWYFYSAEGFKIAVSRAGLAIERHLKGYAKQVKSNRQIYELTSI